MVKTKFQQEVTLPTLQYVWAAPYPCTQLHDLELVVYDFGSFHKILNLAPVHHMPDEVPVWVAQVSIVHCKLIEVC